MQVLKILKGVVVLFKDCLQRTANNTLAQTLTGNKLVLSLDNSIWPVFFRQ